MTHAGTQSYKTTESKYKGGAEEMYVTYDLWQETRGDGRALYPKVKRVYIAGQVKDWHVGTFAKRTGKHVHGVKIVGAWIKGHLSRLELHAGNKWNACGDVH